MKALAHSYVYWSNMNKQLEELVRTCSKCQLAAKSLWKNTLNSWPIPDSPLKLKGERTTQEILKIFLGSYRATAKRP